MDKGVEVGFGATSAQMPRLGAKEYGEVFGAFGSNSAGKVTGGTLQAGSRVFGTRHGPGSIFMVDVSRSLAVRDKRG